MRIAWPLVLLIAGGGCTETSRKSTPIEIKTPEGNVPATVSTVEPTPQTVVLVTGEKLQHLRSLSSSGPKFVEAYLPGTSNPNLKDYDRAFRLWQTSAAKKHSNQEVTDIVGGVLGNKCVDDLGMEWVTVTDQYGTDYAIRSKTVEVMAFPFSSVTKRIEDDEYDFAYNVYYAIKQRLESGQSKEREAPASKD